MNLLDLDKKVCEEYGITGDVDSEAIEKSSFVKIQMSEIRKALWRARVDYIIASKQVEDIKETTSDDGVIQQYQAKASEQKNLIKNFSGSVKTLLELIDELDPK